MEILVDHSLEGGPFAVFFVHALDDQFRRVAMVVHKDDIGIPAVKLLSGDFGEVGVFLRSQQVAACQIDFIPAVLQRIGSADFFAPGIAPINGGVAVALMPLPLT